MSIRYDTDKERTLHMSVIHALAEHYHLDEVMIREIYENRLKNLMDGARVRYFLSLLAERYVKNLVYHTQTPLSGPVHFDSLH